MAGNLKEKPADAESFDGQKHAGGTNVSSQDGGTGSTRQGGNTGGSKDASG